MNNIRINGEDLKAIGYPEGKVIRIALDAIEANFAAATKEEVLNAFKKVAAEPEQFLDDTLFEAIAQALIEKTLTANTGIIPLKETATAYSVFGSEHIEEGAIKQMEIGRWFQAFKILY